MESTREVPVCTSAFSGPLLGDLREGFICFRPCTTIISIAEQRLSHRLQTACRTVNCGDGHRQQACILCTLVAALSKMYSALPSVRSGPRVADTRLPLLALWISYDWQSKRVEGNHLHLFIGSWDPGINKLPDLLHSVVSITLRFMIFIYTKFDVQPHHT